MVNWLKELVVLEIFIVMLCCFVDIVWLMVLRIIENEVLERFRLISRLVFSDSLLVDCESFIRIRLRVYSRFFISIVCVVLQWLVSVLVNGWVRFQIRFCKVMVKVKILWFQLKLVFIGVRNRLKLCCMLRDRVRIRVLDSRIQKVVCGMGCFIYGYIFVLL